MSVDIRDNLLFEKNMKEVEIVGYFRSPSKKQNQLEERRNIWLIEVGDRMCEDFTTTAALELFPQPLDLRNPPAKKQKNINF